MLSTIEAINSAVNNFIWGVPAMICIIGVGLVLSFRTRFLQIRKFPYAMKVTFGRRICRCVIIWFHTQFRYHLLQHILLRQRPFKLCKNPVSINDNACIQICHGKQKPDIKHINFERIQIHEINFPYRKRSSLIKRFIVRPPCQWNLYVAFLITLYHISLWQSRQHF
jgi:hypothetical protein